MRPSRLVNRNVVAERGRTSIRLEPELWDALQEICRREQVGLGELIRRIERTAGDAGGRTSAVRVFVMTYFREASTEEGHRRAGHGQGQGLPNSSRSEWKNPGHPSRELATP